MKIKAKQENCNGIPYDFFDQISNSICFMLSGFFKLKGVSRLKAYNQKNEPSISM
ncbi:hypothetical protein MKY88_01540 [Lysinibacillus sp. FSL R7-0073]|uniref:hypothetical protein n=1 Tax=Lysinibacillus sp. FSL R7-0073 TaxID=2921669 RepID=UPI0030FA8DBD